MKDRLKVFSESYSNILLTGLSGAGKTQVAYFLSKMLGWGFLDTDQLLEKRQGLSSAEIIRSKGEVYFRNCEVELVKSIGFLRNHVISLGGGTFCSRKNRTKLRSYGFSVWLDVSPEVVARRIVANPQELIKRPLLKGNDKIYGSELVFEELLLIIEKLLKERVSSYSQVDKIIRDDYSSAETCARNIYYSILG